VAIALSAQRAAQRAALMRWATQAPATVVVSHGGLSLFRAISTTRRCRDGQSVMTTSRFLRRWYPHAMAAMSPQSHARHYARKLSPCTRPRARWWLRLAVNARHHAVAPHA